MRKIFLIALACGCACGQGANGPAFEAASVKAASPSANPVGCSGGPGTADPGTWTCSNAPLGFLISNAYGLQPYQFSPIDKCCQARFDVAARVPAGTTREEFQGMQQNLLAERFKLALHHEQKEMEIYELTVAAKGPKMKESAPGAAPAAPEPWAAPKFTMGADGYPAFPAGSGGLLGMNGHFRWTGAGLSMPEIVKTLSGTLHRPVFDLTGLKGRYDIDMTWIVDNSAFLALAAQAGVDVAQQEDAGRGPTLEGAVQNRLGLKLTSKKGPGDIVVIDHAEKVPAGN